MTCALPFGWTTAKLDAIGTLFCGQSPRAQEVNSIGKGSLYVSGPDQWDGQKVLATKWTVSPKRSVPDGCIFITVKGAGVGTLFPGPACAIGRDIYAFLPTPPVTREFTHFALQHTIQQIVREASGLIPGLSRADLLEHAVLLPPVGEQRRIVAKLQALLSKVDAARKRLDRVPALLKRFRQAVLAAACSGRLTEDWREANPRERSDFLLRVIRERRRESAKQRGHRHTTAAPSDEFQFDAPESWSRCSMDELTEAITSGSRDWKKYYRETGSGTFVMAQNVRPLRFDRSFRMGVEPPEDDRDRLRSQVKQSDLLVTIVGANTGDCCRVREELRAHYVCQSVALMRPVLPEIAPYLELFLNSVDHGLAEYRRWLYGEGRPHLSFDHLRETAVSLPPLAEQHEIVRRVDALFALADQIEARYAKAKAHVNRLTQSILAKAFRGELVPQDPNDEPASVMLERVRARQCVRQVTGK